jgi:lipopolysaccharide transport system ATP-binding protein
MSEDDYAICVHDISKVFEIYRTPQDRLKQFLFGRWRTFHRNFQALSDVSFSVRRGESVGIIGRNGAGKSTLLQILTGTLQPSSGAIRVDGKVAAVLELGSGFNPEYSGRQNINMYASLFGLSREDTESRFAEIVEFAGLKDFIEQPVKTYSSGMQARLAFSVIAHVDADILIIDEALSVGDAVFTQKCMRFLREFQQRGTILFVSHDMGAVTGFCDRAVWLDRGRVVTCGDAKSVCESYYAFMQTEARGIANAGAPAPDKQIVRKRSTAPGAHQRVARTVSKAEGTLPAGLQKIETFGFNPMSASHGNGDARILDVVLLDATGARLDVAEGGRKVVVRVHIEAVRDVDQPIVGFIIKDRLGQPLVGGNTYHAYKHAPVSARAGEFWEVEFEFQLPILAVGDYSVVAAIGNGTLAEHVHLHWMHDAFHFKVVSTSIEGVLAGVPLDRIDFTVYASDAETSEQA